MRTGAASAVGARRRNENDVTMTIAGLWRYGNRRHVATGCAGLVLLNSKVQSLAKENPKYISRQRLHNEWPMTVN